MCSSGYGIVIYFEGYNQSLQNGTLCRYRPVKIGYSLQNKLLQFAPQKWQDLGDVEY